MSQLKLPRLRDDTDMIDDNNRPSFAFMNWWNQVCKELELQINSINSQLQSATATAQSTANTAQTAANTAQSAANAAQSSATTAQTAANTAQTAANTAQTLANNIGRELSRINSYPNPGSILSSLDAGSSTTITIGNHTRVYPTELGVTIPSVTFTNTPYNITGLAYNTKYWIYYDDTTLASTTPTFLATTSSVTAQVGAASGRHIVGYITTPVVGGSTTGIGAGTPGGGGGGGAHGGYIP